MDASLPPPDKEKGIDLKSFTAAISQIAEEKEIPTEKIIATIETALSAAYKKDYGKKGQVIKAKLDPQTGEAKFWQVKLVVDKKMIYSESELETLKDKKIEPKEEGEKKVRFNPEKHIMINEAKKMNSKIKAGEELEMSLEAQKDYGRIAAQTAKQVVLQKIREAERETILEEYKSREGEIVSGIVQRDGREKYFLRHRKNFGDITKRRAGAWRILPARSAAQSLYFKS